MNQEEKAAREAVGMYCDMALFTRMLPYHKDIQELREQGLLLEDTFKEIVRDLHRRATEYVLDQYLSAEQAMKHSAEFEGHLNTFFETQRANFERYAETGEDLF